MPRLPVLLLSVLTCAIVLFGPMAQVALALLSDQAVVNGNTFSTLSLGAPSALSAEASGHDVLLGWSEGQHGSGYRVEGAVGNGADCTQAEFAILDTAGEASYTDTENDAPQGRWYCYRVLTTVANWTSQSDNPVAPVRLGFFAESLSMVNGGGTSGCDGEQSGQAGELDCGDQVIVEFNQAVDVGSGPAEGETVCAHAGSGSLWLGSSSTSGECSEIETVSLGSLSGSLSGCNCRFSASFDWAQDGRAVTVTVGTRLAGSGYPMLDGTAWTLTPTSDTAKLLSASGGLHICHSNDGDADCLAATE